MQVQWLLAVVVATAYAQPPALQPAAVKNPKEGDADAIRAGSALYRERCASCHGSDARGAAGGSDLTWLWTAGGAAGGMDVPLFQTIRRGLPNSLLPHSFGPDADIWATLAHLRTLDKGTVKLAGDAAAGQRVFDANCRSCHQVNGTGGRLGPDLSQIGASRSRPWLAHKIRHASAYIMNVYSRSIVFESFQPVTLVTRDGRQIRGIKKNEDAFTVQIMDTQERIQGYVKSDLREVVDEKTSIMPDSKLSDADLDHLVAYLATLKGR